MDGKISAGAAMAELEKQRKQLETAYRNALDYAAHVKSMLREASDSIADFERRLAATDKALQALKLMPEAEA